MGKSKANPWPWFIGVLVGIFVTALGGTLFYTARKGLHLVDADYYEKGRTYEQSAKKERNAFKRHMTARIQKTDQGLVVTVSDLESSMVTGAEVSYRVAPPGTAETVLLREESPGKYVLSGHQLADDAAGFVVVRSGDSVLTEKIRVISQ